MLKMVDGTGIIGVDMVCPLGGAVSPPQPPNHDNIEMEGVGSLMLPNSLKAPLERLELIGNSVQSENPAPDNPQEIKSAGRKSKNLLNLQKQPDVKETYLGWKVSDGRNVVLSLKDKGNNADITGCYLGLSRTGGSSDGVVWVVNNGSVAVKEVVSKNQYVSVFPSNETTVRKLLERFDIQVEYGNNATDYEPYGYLLDVKVTGKNLLDMADIQNENGKIDSDFSKAKSIKPFKVIKDRKYLLISKGTMIVDVRYSSIYFGEDDLAYGQDSSRKLTTGTGYSCFIGTETRKILVAKETCTITKTMMHGTRTEKDAYEVEELGLFEIINDNPNIDYAPYTEQFAKIALDEPLRGIGEYKDTITKDGVVRKIHEQTLKKEQISMNEYNWDTKYFRLYVNPDKKIDSSINIYELFSNMFKKFVIYKGNPNVYWIISEEEIRSMGITETDSLQVAYEKIKDFVTTNDIVIQYPIVETTLEPLPESVQAQLQALHSENGTTHVFVDSGEVPCGIKLTYRKEK